MADTEQLSRLHEASRDLYGALLDFLPSGRNHCAEFVSIASALARVMGITHDICGGVQRLSDSIVDQHHWIAIGDQVLHARDGVVELVAASATFEPASRIHVRPAPKS